MAYEVNKEKTNVYGAPGETYGRLEKLQSQLDAINALWTGAGGTLSPAQMRHPEVPPEFIGAWNKWGVPIGQYPTSPARQAPVSNPMLVGGSKAPVHGGPNVSLNTPTVGSRYTPVGNDPSIVYGPTGQPGMRGWMENADRMRQSGTNFIGNRNPAPVGNTKAPK